MALFANKDLIEARRQLDEARSEIERLRKEVARATDKAAASAKAAQGAESERDANRKEAEAARQACDRARESQAKADAMGRWLEERYNQAAARIEGAEQARDAAQVLAKEAVAERDRALSDRERAVVEVERLRTELDAARAARREKPPRVELPEAAAAPVAATDSDEVERLRRELSEAVRHCRLALRKAEHNRRAYLVTQMQLDLAEDRLHLLTKGVPRPILRDPEELDASEPLVAEDVEDFEETPTADE